MTTHRGRGNLWQVFVRPVTFFFWPLPCFLCSGFLDFFSLSVFSFFHSFFLAFFILVLSFLFFLFFFLFLSFSSLLTASSISSCPLSSPPLVFVFVFVFVFSFFCNLLVKFLHFSSLFLFTCSLFSFSFAFYLSHSSPPTSGPCNQYHCFCHILSFWNVFGNANAIFK